MAQKLMAHVVARARCALLKAHGGMAKAALTGTSLRAGDENRTRMASLEVCPRPSVNVRPRAEAAPGLTVVGP
jgi:hypothetical protein